MAFTCSRIVKKRNQVCNFGMFFSLLTLQVDLQEYNILRKLVKSPFLGMDVCLSNKPSSTECLSAESPFFTGAPEGDPWLYFVRGGTNCLRLTRLKNSRKNETIMSSPQGRQLCIFPSKNLVFELEKSHKTREIVVHFHLRIQLFF